MSWKSRFENFMSKIDEHEIFLLGGSLAYTTALALAPFIIILISVVPLLQFSSQQNLIDQMTSVLGPQAGEAVNIIVENAEKRSNFSGVSGLISFVIICISASAIFYQLRIAFDKVNEFKPDPKHAGWLIFLRDRVLSVGLVLGFIFLLMISLFISTLISLIFQGREGSLWEGISSLASLGIFSVLFAAMFRFIPSGTVAWRRCLISGLSASLFFLIGKNLIGLYLGTSAVGSAYGAAGSLVVLLVWIYYTSITLLLSYEFTTAVLFSGETAAVRPALPRSSGRSETTRTSIALH